MATDNVVSLATIVATLTHLHLVKDRIYQDAWRRRGELIGKEFQIFAVPGNGSGAIVRSVRPAPEQ